MVLAVGLQLPLIWALERVAHGRVLPFGLLGGALTAGFFSTLARPRAVWGSPSRTRLYLLLWPFFIWWTGGLLFTLLLPLVLLARALLQASGTAVLQAGLAATAVSTVLALRQRPRVRAREVHVAGLPAAFDGYRIAQISDLHCGPFASGARVGRWVAAVNRLDADLVAVTGDLITSGSAYVATVASALGGLRARDGVYAAMGNHDYFTDGDELARALERAGLTVLRNRGVEVARAGAALYVAGVDDTWTDRDDMERALAARPAAAPVVLLAHDPALFPDAAARGVDLTLSGHTHGGQVALPGFAKQVNLARVMTRFTTGLYRSGSSILYVNRGLGTTGPPLRLAVRPEIAVITLRRGGAAAGSASQPAQAQRAANG